MSSARHFYTETLETYSKRLNTLKSKLRWFGWYRFLFFILVFAPYFFVGSNVLGICISLVFLIVFLYLVKQNIRLEKETKRAIILIQIAKDELQALEHSFLHFQDGSEYIDPEHFFSYDLDLFGKGSLFQFLNRTVTAGGKNMLAGWLQNPFTSKTEIEKRQEAIRELAEHSAWRLNFLSDGKLFEETSEMDKEIRSWSELELNLGHNASIRHLLWIIPFLTLASAIPALLGISNLLLYLMLLVQWFFLFFFWKIIAHYFRFFGRKSELLAKYMQLVNHVESSKFQAGMLVDFVEKIQNPSAAKAFRALKSLVKEFEYRQNILVGFFLNSFFLWDIRCVYKLWKWHRNYSSKLGEWLGIVANFDALVSLANFTNNQPSFVFPELVENDFEFSCSGLGHPLLHPLKRVNNNLEMSRWSQVLIVTGANMAGKSTFLRTVGVNLVLARMGAPVCAESMHVTPVSLYTNMRTTDSLLKDESYFFAELRRIKTVLDRLLSGERYLIILDEMLKGTNSVDKLNGSKALIRKLVSQQAVAIVATHDLKLSEMEKEFPAQVSNKCFEIRIVDDELIFDYKLTNGVTQTMNASFLMKKMGIV